MAYVGDISRFSSGAPAKAHVARTLGWAYVIGSCATLGGAFVLWRLGARAAAAGVILISPVPCPPGMPC